MLQPVVSKAIIAGITAKSHIPAVRNIISQRSDSNNYNPRQQIYINIPNGHALTDLRDSYLTMDVEFPTIIAPIADVTVFECRDTANAVAVTVFGTFQIQFGASTSPCLSGATSPAALEAAINNLYDFQRLVIKYGGSVTVTPAETFVLTGRYIITINSDNYEASLTTTNSPVFSMTSGLTGGVGVPLHVVCDTVASVSGARAYPRMEYNYASIIQRVEIHINGQVVMECGNAHILASIISYEKNRDYIETQADYWGVGSDLLMFWRGQRRLGIDLRHFELLRSVLPLNYSPETSFKIVLTLAAPNDCLVWKTLNDNLTYNVNNVDYHYHSLKLHDEDLIDQITAQIQSPEGLVYPYISYDDITNQINSSGNIDMLLSWDFQRFLGIYAVQRRIDYISDPENERKLSTFLRSSIDNARLKSGQTYFPLDAIEMIQNPLDFRPSLIEGWMNYINFAQLEDPSRQSLIVPLAGVNYNSSGLFDTIVLDGEFFMPSTFILGISTDPSDNHQYNLDEASYGWDTTGTSNTSLELRNINLITEDTPGGATSQHPVELTVFGKYTSFLTFSAGNRTTYIR